MKNAVWFATPLLFAVSCAQPNGNAANAEPSDASAKAANTRPDGSVIDESKPHDHTAATAHDKPMAMDMACGLAGLLIWWRFDDCLIESRVRG